MGWGNYKLKKGNNSNQFTTLRSIPDEKTQTKPTLIYGLQHTTGFNQHKQSLSVHKAKTKPPTNKNSK